MDFANLIPLVLPKDLDGAKFPDFTDVLFWKNFENRTFYIDYEITYADLESGIPDTVSDINNISNAIMLMNLEEKDTPENELKPIYIYIDSMGGALDPALALCDVIIASRIPVVTIALSNAYSAAFLIYLAGKRRYLFKHSSLLCHQGSLSVAGSAAEFEEASKNYKQQLEEMKTYVLERTSIPEAVFKKNQKKDWYFTPEEVKNYQLGSVIERLEDIK